jgi:hypothetical protein
MTVVGALSSLRELGEMSPHKRPSVPRNAVRTGQGTGGACVQCKLAGAEACGGRWRGRNLAALTNQSARTSLAIELFTRFGGVYPWKPHLKAGVTRL